MTIVLSIALILSLIANGAAFFAARRLANIVFGIEDQINDSLDVLDTSYKKLSKIASTPVLYDDPQVKAAVDELKKARDAIVLVANKITTGMNPIDENRNDVTT